MSKTNKVNNKPVVKSAKALPGFIYPLLGAILLIGASVYFLGICNSDTLYMAQGRSFFAANREFFDECMRQPAGFTAWLGSYLTQYFYHTWTGVAIMTTMLLALYFLCLYVFKVKRHWALWALIPSVAILCSEIDLGYWIYYLKLTDYWYSNLIGFTISVLCFSVAHAIRPSWGAALWVSLVVLVGYPLIGWYALLVPVYAIVHSVLLLFKGSSKGKRFARLYCICLLAVIVVPILWYQFYTELRLEDAWIAGLPLLKADRAIGWAHLVPFAVLAFSPILLMLASSDSDVKKGAAEPPRPVILAVANILLVCAMGYALKSANFDNSNYHSELRMYRAVEEQRWDDALSIMADIPGDATREMVLFKDICVMNTGHMGDQLFKYNNMGEPPYTTDSLCVHMVQTAAPLIYYNFGRCNFSNRWMIENTVEYGCKFNDLKLLTLDALVSGEKDLALKYINILEQSTFYGEWAAKYRPYATGKKDVRSSNEFKLICELHDNFHNVLDGDQGLCEMYLLNYFSNTQNKDSKLVNEVTLMFALIQKDIQLFWPKFFLYASLHSGAEMPIHYQEAAYLYGHLESQVDIRPMPFDEDKIVGRYANFTSYSQQLLKQGLSVPQVGEAMKPLYGDTFWWFYYFCRDLHSY